MLAGMGLEGLTGWLGRKQFFVDAIAMFETAARGDKHWMAIQFMKTMKVDRVAASLLLPTFTDAHPDWLAAFTMETMVLCGTEDKDNGSAPDLAAALPNATLVEVPGTHMSSVTKPEFGDAIAGFFGPA
jgi:pimeloyl-ACP methyl ester carboxylesterase